MAFDLPLWSVVETAATLYQKDEQRFHLLLTEPLVQDEHDDLPEKPSIPSPSFPFPTPRLLWLEISPYRVIMTMQGNGKFSYRHFWEQGVYGLSRYWLQEESFTGSAQLRLRNFTRSLILTGNSLPQNLRIEYELWSDQVRLGHYVLNLDVHH
jgi:hypothetical protein